MFFDSLVELMNIEYILFSFGMGDINIVKIKLLYS